MKSGNKARLCTKNSLYRTSRSPPVAQYSTQSPPPFLPHGHRSPVSPNLLNLRAFTPLLPQTHGSAMPYLSAYLSISIGHCTPFNQPSVSTGRLGQFEGGNRPAALVADACWVHSCWPQRSHTLLELHLPLVLDDHSPLLDAVCTKQCPDLLPKHRVFPFWSASTHEATICSIAP